MYHGVCKKLVDAGRWSDENGDRRSRLVLIGMNMNKPLIERKLTEALVTPEETKVLGGVDGWRQLADPFFDGECANDFFELKVNGEWEEDQENTQCNL